MEILVKFELATHIAEIWGKRGAECLSVCVSLYINDNIRLLRGNLNKMPPDGQEELGVSRVRPPPSSDQVTLLDLSDHLHLLLLTLHSPLHSSG